MADSLGMTLLEKATRLAAIGVLTRSAAHDVNNHMSAILTFADLVLEALPDDHPIRAEVEEIRLAGFRAVERTRELDQIAHKLVPIGTKS